MDLPLAATLTAAAATSPCDAFWVEQLLTVTRGPAVCAYTHGTRVTVGSVERADQRRTSHRLLSTPPHGPSWDHAMPPQHTSMLAARGRARLK